MLRNGLVLTAAALAFLASGCSSDQGERQSGRSDHRKTSLPPLAGQDTFFDGQITAELTVGHGAGFDRKPGKEDEEPGAEHKRHGGGGGFRMGGGGGGGGRRHQENDSAGDDGGASGQIDRERAAAMRRAANANPPVMIHLRFTNNGTSPAELLVADFLSPLGNFVVEPEKLNLAPGHTIEVEPMTSRLAGEISGATVTLALRLAGKGEKKNITLSIAPESSAPQEAPADIPAGTK